MVFNTPGQAGTRFNINIIFNALAFVRAIN